MLDKYKVEYFRLDHITLTYGFVLYNEVNECLFSYIPDTIWTKTIENVLNKKPKIVIIDLNGKKDDKHKVHVSIEDLLDKGLIITKNETKYYGTHLKEEFESNNNLINCCKTGDHISL